MSVYSPQLHYLPLGLMSERLMADNLATQVLYANAVMAADPDSRWASINANHMLPSGSSLFHPHLQGVLDPTPTTLQRQLADVPAERFNDYLDSGGRPVSGSSATRAAFVGGELRADRAGGAARVRTRYLVAGRACRRSGAELASGLVPTSTRIPRWAIGD